MTAEAEPNPSDVPFKDPDVSQPLQLQSESEAFAATPADAVIAPAPDAAPISLHASSDPQEANEVDADLSSSQLVDYLRQALDALRGLNLEGFRQIYPVFLVVFGTVVLGLALSVTVNVLQAINQLPLCGGLLQGLAELIGLVALVRFVSANLLLQHKRAELFVRIAALKKDLLG